MKNLLILITCALVLSGCCCMVERLNEECVYWSYYLETQRHLKQSTDKDRAGDKVQSQKPTNMWLKEFLDETRPEAEEDPKNETTHR